MILGRFISSVVSPSAFGLDISDFTVKFMKLGRSAFDEISVRTFGEVKIPEGTVVAGEIKKENELALFLKNNLRTSEGERFFNRFVVATLPEEKSFVRLIQLPKMKSEDIGKAARWELEGVVPLPIEELYFDYAILPSKEAVDHFDLLVAAFPRVLIDSYVRVLEEAGFVPVALELESQAISRALWSGEEGAFIFVDLGATRMSSMIMAAGSLILTFSVPLGGRDFDRVIAERLGVSIDRARDVKFKAGLAKEKDGMSREALMPLVSALSH